MSEEKDSDNTFDEVNGQEFDDFFKKDIIIAKNLIKDYEIGEFIIRAIDNVSLSIEAGAFVVIKGPSGAGKTTLLRLLSGIERPTQGEIYSFGVKISDMLEESVSTFRLAHHGFVFQNYNLISTLSAEENVIFPMNLSGIPIKRARARAVELLNKVGLSERKEHLPFQLSAGEQQRAALVRALANDPPLIFADEPTANLDKYSSMKIKDIFQELKEKKKTIILATHDDNLIQLANRIIEIDEGQIKNDVMK
ncbi:MAG: ABC transporter ATP-binding protein [Promethearchaeota archaeon]